MANKYDYLMSIDTDFKLKDIGGTKILNDLKEVELVLLNITKDYGFSKTARSLALDLMDYNVDEKTIKDFNKKYGSKSVDDVMIYIAREYDKGFLDFMDVYSKKSVRKSMKENLSKEFADLLRRLINSVDELDEYGDIENLFSTSLWLKAFDVRDRAEEILKENRLKI